MPPRATTPPRLSAGEALANRLSPPPPPVRPTRRRRHSSPWSLGWIVKKLLLGGIFIFTILQLWFFLHILWWKINPPSSTAFMRERAAENASLKIHYSWVPYKALSPHLKRALIAAEDAHFLSHHGFDWDGIRIALEKNKRRGYIAAGGSTISQQLAKNLFLSPDKNFFRKGQEAIITLMLEYTWSKAQILETYLNVIEWGDGIFGAEAAAHYYFKTSAARLTPSQAARLAAMVPRPRTFQKQFNSSYISHRSNTIRARLEDVEAP